MKALMVVDVQNWGFTGDWPVPNHDELLAGIQGRIDETRARGDLVVWVQNDGPEGELDAPGLPFWELTLQPADGETIWRKTTQDVFESNPNLAPFLAENGVTEVHVIGLQSEMCVRSSTIGARAAGFSARVIPGLHGTYPEGFFEPTGPRGKTAAEISAEVDAELSSRVTPNSPAE